jgi:hypothetical protein
MMEARMRAIRFVTGAALALALPAAAAPLDEAKALLDALAPVHCELLKMQFQASGIPLESAARGALAQRYAERATAIEQATAADMQRFEAARAMLDGPGRDELTAHGTALMQACAAEARRETGVRIPVQPATQPQLKAAPYVPPQHKAMGVEAAPRGAIEAQDPQ